MTQSEFEAIALQLRKKVRATIVRMLSSADAADDAASDVMLRLWALHDQLNDDSHAFKLALVIARNVSIDMVRRQKRSYALFADAEKGVGQPAGRWASPSEKMELEEEERWLVQRMKKLPPRELQVLRMRQMEMRSNEEIARLLGIGEASVGVMLSAARKKLFNDIKRRNRQ